MSQEGFLCDLTPDALSSFPPSRALLQRALRAEFELARYETEKNARKRAVRLCQTSARRRRRRIACVFVGIFVVVCNWGAWVGLGAEGKACNAIKNGAQAAGDDAACCVSLNPSQNGATCDDATCNDAACMPSNPSEGCAHNACGPLNVCPIGSLAERGGASTWRMIFMVFLQLVVLGSSAVVGLKEERIEDVNMSQIFDSDDEDDDAARDDPFLPTSSRDSSMMRFLTPLSSPRGSLQAERGPIPLSPEERQALSDLKTKIEIMDNTLKGHAWITETGDAMYLKFLKGHELNVDESFKCLMQCGVWRQDYRTAGVLRDWPINQSISVRMCRVAIPFGRLCEGVFLYRMVMCDFPGLFKACGTEIVVRDFVYKMEKLFCQDGGMIDVGIRLIIDLGYNHDEFHRPITSLNTARNWVSWMMHYLGELMKIFDPYYPEVVDKVYIVRAPAMFWSTWRVVQMLIPKRTQNKIVIMTVDDSNPIKLVMHMPKHAWPEYLICGGAKLSVDFPTGGLVSSLRLPPIVLSGEEERECEQ